MNKIYFQKITFLSIFILLLVNDGFSQCSVSAPADVTINCGQTATLVANTNVPTYSYSSSTCAPVVIAGTNAFPTACDDCVTGDINIGFPFNFMEIHITI